MATLPFFAPQSMPPARASQARSTRTAPTMQPGPTVTDLLHAYERDVLPSKSQTTQRAQRLTFASFRREFGAMPLEDITPTWLRAWKEHLLARCKPGTVRRYLMELSGPLTAAVKDYAWLAVNPMSKVRKPSAEKRERCLTPEEHARLLTVCQRSTKAAWYPLILLAVATGCRKNELCALRWESLDSTTGTLRLRTTKNKAPKVVPVVGTALMVLRQWCERPLARCAWVFPRKDGRGPVDIRRDFELAVARADIEDFKFHDVRHTCASYLAMSGATTEEIAAVLGHTNIQQAHNYTHLMPAHTRSVVERMAQQFLTPEEPPDAPAHP